MQRLPGRKVRRLPGRKVRPRVAPRGVFSALCQRAALAPLAGCLAALVALAGCVDPPPPSLGGGDPDMDPSAEVDLSAGPADAGVPADSGGADSAPQTTCDDGVRNGDELGVDCGGACPACPPPPECEADGDCGNGSCSAEGTCVCDPGFVRAEGACVDADECDDDPCGAGEVCRNTVGGFACDCLPGGQPGEAGCVFSRSCKALKAADPAAADGAYVIDADGEGPAPPVAVYCDLTTDDGAGYTIKIIEDPEALPAGAGVQPAYRAACEALGLELVVPRSRPHLEALVAVSGGRLNLVGVYPDVAGAAGLNRFSGRCQGQPCDFWLSDSNSASCQAWLEPSGDNDLDSALLRQEGADCAQGAWNDAHQAVEIGGTVVCSTNDAGPTPRTCLDALTRALRINAGGDGDGFTGVYTLDPDGDGPAAPYRAWCDQTAAGGGWTLVLKTAAQSALSYDHPAWTGPEDLNSEAVDLSPGDARLAGYGQVPVGQVRLVMAEQQVIATVDEVPQFPSMLALMAGPMIRTNAGRRAWLMIVSETDGGLQPHCNLEGFNMSGGGPRVRFGILGNNEQDCVSTDSFIGIGHTGDSPCDRGPVYSGNTAAVQCGGGLVSRGLAGLLYVREAQP